MKNKAILLVLLASLTTGCATIREREAEDPGHGGFLAVLTSIDLAASVIACPAASLADKINATATATNVDQVIGLKPVDQE